MSIYCVFMFLALCGERPGLGGAQIPLYTAAQGEDITASFVFSRPGNWRILCKNYCNIQEDVLVISANESAQIGRYGMEYEEQYSGHNVMFVSVTNVSSADQGLYRCVLEQWVGQTRTHFLLTDFFIQVVTAPSSLDPEVAPTLTDPLYNGSGSSGLSEDPPCPTAAAHGVLPYLALTLVIIIISMTLTFLYHMKKVNEQKSAATECSPVSKTEEDSSNVMYAEVDLSRISSAPRCRTEAVIYSVPRVQTEETPLYSTVSLPQNSS